MIEINLIPDVKQELIKAQRIRAAVISLSIVIGVAAIAVVTILSIYVFGVQTVRSALADDAIKKGNEKLQSNADLSKVLTIQNQLTKISSLNSSKSIDSRLFDVLAAIIPPAPNQVQVTELIIDNLNNKISIQGQSSGKYESLQVFKKTIAGTTLQYGEADNLQKVALATDISTADVSYGEDSNNVKVLRFSLSFVYPVELFAPGTTNLKIIDAEKGNVTDSYLGLPQSVFTTRARDAGTE